MAIHPNIPSMLQESLYEMLLTAKNCIEFRKDIRIWKSPGCYGYPAALLLLSIIDSVGSYVEQGNVKNHFKVLNNPKYYGLSLNNSEIQILYKNYRSLLSHNTVMALNASFNIGLSNNPILFNNKGNYSLNLVPLYNASVTAVIALLGNQNIFTNNKTIVNICKII